MIIKIELKILFFVMTKFNVKGEVMSQLPENLPVVNKEKIAELIDNKN